MSDGPPSGQPSSEAAAPQIQRVIAETVPDLPKDKKDRLMMEISKVSVTYQGPLPPSHELARYGEIIPGGADRLMKLVEDQTAHRMQMENKIVDGQHALASRGQLFGLAIGIFGLGVAAFLGYIGESWLGGVIGGTTVTALAVAFITGRRSQAHEQQLPVSPPVVRQGKKAKHRR
jgi:uncharacterized membrane protein